MSKTYTRESLISSQARIQVPWVQVKIGDYIFGVRNSKNPSTAQGTYQWTKNKETTRYFPNYITQLQVTKINGEVNQYVLSIVYPVRPMDDPNFFEKVFGSVSNSRKIVFTYGDASQPNYIYKDEEAIITDVTTSFNFGSSGGDVSAIIGYTVKATSSANLISSGSYSFGSREAKPSIIIKDMFKNAAFGLQSIFTGMNINNLDNLIDGSDKRVHIDAKTNISALDYIKFLVGCMVPASATTNGTSKDIYILTLHDDTTYDTMYNDTTVLSGPYFKVTRTSYLTEHADAYEVDIGYNTATIVTGFSLSDNQTYSILYDYQEQLNTEEYIRKLNSQGQWEDVYAPVILSKNDEFKAHTSDVTWWTKITKYPVSGSIKVQGLLRPAHLLQYIRLNVIFPGGHKHISSGLYIVTKQVDTISESGYTTELGITKISGDNSTPNYE